MNEIDSEFFRGGSFFSWLNPRNWQWTRDRFFSRPTHAAMYGTDNPVIEIDCNNSMTAYLDCPHFRAVIDKGCDMFSNGEWKCVSITDEEKEFPDDPGLKLLNKPNPLQSREEFLWQAYFFKLLFANNFVYKPSGSVFVLPKVMWHLPSDEMKIKFKNMQTFYDQYELSGMIDSFLLCQGSVTKPYEVKDMLYKAENFSFKEGKGTSKIPSLKLPINNLVASLRTRNVLSVNFGVRGILSVEDKDMHGALPVKQGDKDIVNEQLSSDHNLYSGKSKMKVASRPIKFTQVSGNVNDMKLLESEEADFKVIAAIMGFPKDLFPFTSGATFENQIQAKKGAYEDTIIPGADSFSGAMTESLKPKAGRKYILSYAHLGILKEDEVKEAEAEKLEAETQEILHNNGVINAQAFADNLGVPFSGDGIIKQRSSAKAPSAQVTN